MNRQTFYLSMISQKKKNWSVSKKIEYNFIINIDSEPNLSFIVRTCVPKILFDVSSNKYVIRLGVKNLI